MTKYVVDIRRFYNRNVLVLLTPSTDKEYEVKVKTLEKNRISTAVPKKFKNGNNILTFNS